MLPKALSGFGIVITRPQDQAQTLGQSIQSAGGEAFYFPLIEIAGLENYSTFEQTIAQLDQFDLIIFISSNAVQNAMPRIAKCWPDLPSKCQFAAIGPVTAQALKEAGVTQVLTPETRFDSESFLAMESMQHMQGKKVLIVRGVGGRELLANTLEARGAKVQFAECYQRINPQKNLDFLLTLAKKHSCHAIVITSSEAMQHYLTMLESSRVAKLSQADYHLLQKVNICVNHARIAEHPLLKNFNVHIASTAGDAAMLDCITKALTLP
jgi:uroporphyrinogen-III synthase